MRTVRKLTLDDARVIMDAAEKKASQIDVDMDIAITDDSGSLLMFHRMDDARITSIDVSINKAFTAAAARRSTRAYAEASQPGGPAFGINVSNQGRFMVVAGGLPTSRIRSWAGSAVVLVIPTRTKPWHRLGSRPFSRVW